MCLDVSSLFPDPGIKHEIVPEVPSACASGRGSQKKTRRESKTNCL